MLMKIIMSLVHIFITDGIGKASIDECEILDGTILFLVVLNTLHAICLIECANRL